MKKPPHVIKIGVDGTVTTLYTDKINLRRLGPLKVERASNVEYDEARQSWTVQFVDGTYLGYSVEMRTLGSGDTLRPRVVQTIEEASHFPSRDLALAAEVAYLQARL